MRDERQMTDSCVYLADCYEDLFFGNVNKRYRSMTAAQLKSRMERLNAQTLEEVAKPNELSDIHAMTAKACSYVMGRRQRARTEEQQREWDELRERLVDFCHQLAAKDLEFLPPLTRDELEQVLKMQGIRRYLLSNSLERAYQLFYVPKTIKKGIPAGKPMTPWNV